jgi:hypothetical protein
LRIGFGPAIESVVEFIGRAHQPDVAFLDQIQQVQAAVRVLLCHTCGCWRVFLLRFHRRQRLLLHYGFESGTLGLPGSVLPHVVVLALAISSGFNSGCRWCQWDGDCWTCRHPSLTPLTQLALVQ